MGLFQKKKKEEEIEEEEIVDLKSKKKLPKSKEFKDLKPENKRTRKEVKKAWGRKERGIITFLLLATASTSAILSLSSHGWKAPRLPRFSALSSLPFIGSEEIVLEGDPSMQVKAKEMLTEIKNLTRDYSGVYGVYVIDLSTGTSFGLYETETFQAASLIKLPVIAAAYVEAEKGTFSLNDIYKLSESDKRGGAGSLASRPAGTKFTYRELITLMGKESDNTAYTAMRRIVGDRAINDAIDTFGMSETSIADNLTTPKDIGRFFQTLWKGTVLSDEDKEEFISLLTDTSYEDWIPKGLPSPVVVAHKFGREVHVINDAGIVFTDSPYVLVIMSKGIVEKEADKVLPEISQITFEGNANKLP